MSLSLLLLCHGTLLNKWNRSGAREREGGVSQGTTTTNVPARPRCQSPWSRTVVREQDRRAEHRYSQAVSCCVRYSRVGAYLTDKIRRYRYVRTYVPTRMPSKERTNERKSVRTERNDRPIWVSMAKKKKKKSKIMEQPLPLLLSILSPPRRIPVFHHHLL